MAHPFIRSALSTVCYVATGARSAPGIPVLAYHRVTDACTPGPMVVSPQQFYDQMDYLQREKYEVLSLPAYLTYMRTSSRFSVQRKVVITFDDGWEDTYLSASPILRQFGYAATVFLTTGAYPKSEGDSFLTDDQIQTMRTQGILFGAHTVNHPKLGKLSRAEATHEISASCKTVRERAGMSNDASVSFCYPYGSYTDETIQLVREAGCSCAFTVHPGRNRPGADRFQLCRTSISGQDTLFDFKKKLYGAYDMMHSVVQKLLKVGVER